MNKLSELVEQIELHSVDGIRKCFAQGISPNDLFNNEPLIYELTSEYTRTPRFKDCVQAFVDNGLRFEDKALLSVLLNDANSLTSHLHQNPSIISTSYSLRCAYTPLHKVTLLHICAEFNHVACAEVLIANGADVNAKAGSDEFGFGGQTPIFHTVNQNGNQSIDMLNYLLAQSASLGITVKGFIWGNGYPWETLIPSVNPISYAMMGLLPQMHRDERTISDVVAMLLRHQYGIVYSHRNIPNAYLK
jgi:hypothetical protein